ncbi:unnamed protein product [Brassica rapa]|uniref:Uncharacterized protein n=1 Tax=Brassica campestris TaxID=3711 RepID=A0A8D9DM60_BRACM|nr:unnamed protein product [Brassica rapa]
MFFWSRLWKTYGKSSWKSFFQSLLIYNVLEDFQEDFLEDFHGSPSGRLPRKSSGRLTRNQNRFFRYIKSFKLVVHSSWCIDGNGNILNT